MDLPVNTGQVPKMWQSSSSFYIFLKAPYHNSQMRSAVIVERGMTRVLGDFEKSEFASKGDVLCDEVASLSEAITLLLRGTMTRVARLLNLLIAVTMRRD